MSFILIQILIFLGLLLLSAFFSGSETAFFSLQDSDISRLKETEDHAGKRVVKLLENPRRLLTTVLTGNTLVNITIGALAALLASTIAHNLGVNELGIVAMEVVVVTIVILVAGEITPKIIAISNTRKFSKSTALPLRFFYRLLYPVAYVLYNLTKFFTRLLGVKKENLFLSEAEIRTLVELGESEGALQTQEKEMIHSIFEFGETYVREIMVPRIDMVAVPTSMKVAEVLEQVKKYRFSRIPVYERRVDNINGIVFAKDLLPYVNGRSGHVRAGTLARSAYFVPEKMKIDILLREFQQRKTNIAIVVDEYGGTSGLVTLEDIIEEIVGEIRDEYDLETPLYRWLDSHTLIVNARFNLDDLEEVVHLGIPEERDFDTLGGFLYSQVGDIPEQHTEIEYNGVNYTILRVEENRITPDLKERQSDGDTGPEKSLRNDTPTEET